MTTQLGTHHTEPINGSPVISNEAEIFTVSAPTPAEWIAKWPYIKQGLEAVKRNTPTVTWQPEQIRRAVERQQNGCEFFFCKEAGEVIGFYIMLPQLDPWMSCALTWLCWIVYSSDHGIIDRIEPVVLGQARERGFSDVRFITAQARIVQHMRAKGWRAVETVCRKVVDY